MKALNFDHLPWQALGMSTSWKPAFDAIDHAFTSGHVLYRIKFVVDRVYDRVLDINMRHRGTVYLNNQIISNHIVYSLGIFRPGSKNGPDNTLGGWKSIKLDSKFLKEGLNTLVVLIESFGLNRAPFSFDDIRSPRGIIEAKISNVLMPEWEICGVDVRKLKEAYNSTGIPNENDENGFAPITCSIHENASHLSLADIRTPVWFKTTFDFHCSKDVRYPIRISIKGPATCYVSINRTIIARYYGNGDGPQSDFYIPDGILRSKQNEVKLFAYSTTDQNEWLQLELKPWKVDSTWSGNLTEEGKPLMMVSEAVFLE
jgi:hypothetical protein